MRSLSLALALVLALAFALALGLLMLWLGLALAFAFLLPQRWGLLVFFLVVLALALAFSLALVGLWFRLWLSLMLCLFAFALAFVIREGTESGLKLLILGNLRLQRLDLSLHVTAGIVATFAFPDDLADPSQHLVSLLVAEEMLVLHGAQERQVVIEKV